MSTYDEGPSRSQVRTVECPACGAEPEEKCRKNVRSLKRGPERESNHMERVHAYVYSS